MNEYKINVNMKENLISIVTPMYNGEKYVEETINSVLKQTYPNWEMIIVDDGSKDNGPAIVEKFAQADNRIKLIRQKNAGSSAARNNGLKNIQGRYVSFLDSDDFWEPNFLEEQLNFKKKKKSPIVFASYKRINAEGREILKPFIVPEKVNYKGLLKSCSISCLTAMFDREKTGNVFFNEAMGSLRDDFVFWLSILKQGISIPPITLLFLNAIIDITIYTTI